jgi:hypothetical protein
MLFDRYIEAGNGDFAVDLFPYKIKDVNNFYVRDHPKKINPKSTQFKNYWEPFLKRCIEGDWVNDGGTWVYNYPKMFFFLNYVQMTDAKTQKIFNPDMVDNGIIMFTYLFCSEGFSGFYGDPDYTCNKILGKLNSGLVLESFEEEELKADLSVFKKDGTYKKYVDPWVYLTETYLINDNRGIPLGKPVFSNGYYNAMLLCARGTHKSTVVFLGHLLHELLFLGVKDYSERKDRVNNRALFGVASNVSDALAKSINVLSGSYNNMPGKFEFMDPKKKGKVIPYLGPFYKKIRGNLKFENTKHQVTHELKEGSATQSKFIEGFMMQMSPIAPGKASQVFTGDRFRQAIVEEVGFLDDLLKLIEAVTDSLKANGIPVGQLIMLGTGGDSNKILESKKVFENPEAYNVFGIPNYWLKDLDKKCGLFIGAYYKDKRFKDGGVNTRLQDSLLYVIKDRELSRVHKTVEEYNRETMWNPIYPKELLRPTSRSVIPKLEISEWRQHLIETGLWRSSVTIGSLDYSAGNVIFKPDLEGKLTPIIDWGKDKQLTDKLGAWLLYEDTPSYIPNGMYYILLDPIQSDGEGTSLMSIIVYKRDYVDNKDESYRDTVVATYLGRYQLGGELQKNHEEVIKAARYFNANIIPEANSSDFSAYVVEKNLVKYTEQTPYKTLESIKGSTIKAHRGSSYTFGIRTNVETNKWAIERLADWLTKVVETTEDGIPIRRNYHKIKDLRLLHELEHFELDNKSDFDAVSALMLLPFYLSEWSDDLEDFSKNREEEEDEYSKYSPVSDNYQRKRAEILNY